ncbi:hypothetical protein CBS14141_000762 [Malassezia furfur]|nr:hypothetical protein CBS14141_000762 [Malassezia furfur]
MSARRAEIEAKRAKLAELRRAREERARRAQEPAEEARPPSAPVREDLDALVASLIAPKEAADETGEARAAQQAAAHSSAAPASDAKPAEDATQAGDARAPPARARPATMRGQQRCGVAGRCTARRARMHRGTDTAHGASAAVPPAAAPGACPRAAPAPAPPPNPLLERGPNLAAGVPRCVACRVACADAEAHADAAEPRAPTPPASPPADELGAEFAAFVHAKSAVIERVLDEDYDVLTDYTRVPADADVSGTEALRHVHTFFDAALETRAVMDVDWSTQHPELLVAAYNRSRAPASDADGLVAVWNVHLRERPEFTFQAPTDVTAVLASPFHPTLLVGGTYSGQILVWDTRQRALPVQRTPLAFSPGAGSGHCAPVYSLRMVGTGAAHQLVSASTDGLVCTWAMDLLARPQESLLLANPLHPRSAEVGVTSLDVPADDATRFLLGTEEGNVYGAARYDRRGPPRGLDTSLVSTT